MIMTTTVPELLIRNTYSYLPLLIVVLLLQLEDEIEICDKLTYTKALIDNPI